MLLVDCLTGELNDNLASVLSNFVVFGLESLSYK